MASQQRLLQEHATRRIIALAEHSTSCYPCLINTLPHVLPES